MAATTLATMDSSTDGAQATPMSEWESDAVVFGPAKHAAQSDTDSRVRAAAAAIHDAMTTPTPRDPEPVDDEA